MSLGRNVLKLTTSRVASQSFVFAIYPLISRMYIPEDFGIRQIFMSIVIIFGMAASLQYESSIPLGKNDKEASASFVLSVTISLFFSLILLSIIPFVKSHIAGWFKSPDLEKFLWLVPIVIFFTSLQSSLQHWMSYKAKFGSIAWSEFLSAGIGGASPIGWYFLFGRSLGGLLTNIFIGGIIANLILLSLSYKVIFAGVVEGGVKSIISAAKYHRKFPIYETWSCLLYAFSVQMPTFVLGSYFTPHIVGQYALSHKTFSMPMWLLAGAICQVFFPTASKEYNNTGELSKIVTNTFKRLVQIGAFPMAVFGFLGPLLFTFIFGQQWAEAGVYTQILSSGTFFVFIASPLTVVFPIINRQGTSLIFSASLILGRLIALVIGSKTGNPKFALILFVIVSIIGWAILLDWIFRNTKSSRKQSIAVLIKYAALSCLLLLPSIAINLFLDLKVLTIISIGFAGLAYVAFLYKFDPGSRNMVTDLFGKFGIRKKGNNLVL